MFKGKFLKLTRTYISTVLAASLVLSLFPGSVLNSSLIRPSRKVSAYGETQFLEEDETSETTEETTIAPTEETSADPTEDTTTVPTEETTTETVETTEPTTEPTDLTDPSTVPSGEDTTASEDESETLPPEDSTSETTSEPSEEETEMSESATESSSESTSESYTDPTSEPTYEDPSETTGETTEETTAETTAEPSESSSEPSESVTEPEETTTESTTETTMEPSESTSEPTEPSETTAPEYYESVTLNKMITDRLGKRYSFTATYTMDSGLPKDAELVVKEITDGPEYEAYLAEVQATLEDPDIDQVHLFDISIMKDGVELQPEDGSKVSVEIRLDETVSDDMSVVHFPDDPGNGSAEVIDSSTSTEGDSTVVSFDAESFSVYAVIDHENQTVVNPRVMFHFIADGATEANGYYIGNPYQFKNKAGNYQTTQILSNGESLELFADPLNRDIYFFYGWYTVDPYVISGTTNPNGIGLGDGKLYFTWPNMPGQIPFEHQITIEESSVAIGDTVHWSINGVRREGVVDSDGNVHAFLAPVFEKYNFVNFMLYPRDAQIAGANTLMTRKMVARGSSDIVEVKISDVRSSSSDPIHLIFTGWEYFDGTDWVQINTVDYTGAEIIEAGKDGTYMSINLADMSSVDLYPIFVEARWVDFVSGVSGSGASYVPSRYLESWSNAAPGMTEQNGKTVFTTVDTSRRNGYSFDGWYAFANYDEHGEITNLTTPENVKFSYLDPQNRSVHEVTVNTTAVKIANADGSIGPIDSVYLVVNGSSATLTFGDNAPQGAMLLFGHGSTSNSLKLYDAIDRLTLHAKWSPNASQIAVVYWTEKEQGKGYTAPLNEKDDYTANAVKVIQTEDLNLQSAEIGKSFYSGSTITLNDLKKYKINNISVLDRDFLGEIGAEAADEEKFFDLNEALSDVSAVIKGDGSTTINVYFSRKVFKIVFHIGHDGYVKINGQQRSTEGWDGNWIEYMFDDPVERSLYPIKRGNGGSYAANFSMTYHNPYTNADEVYTTAYHATADTVMGDYVPDPSLNPDDTNVYVITAKYGAYIGDRWPTPVNSNFEFTYNNKRSMYIWAGYYGSLYCRLAHERPVGGNQMGSNPDINGVYEYMSKELCSNRAGDDIINENCVHHLVAYYGDTGKTGITKHYHFLYEAIDGTYDENSVTLQDGTDYLVYPYAQTTWSTTFGDASRVSGRHHFYEAYTADVISNLGADNQLCSDIDGYDQIYACYNKPESENNQNHHIYFFFTPKKYTLTFKFEGGEENWVSLPYYYTQTLSDAKTRGHITDPEKEGYEFVGWFTNETGAGEPFDFANERMPDENVILYPVMHVLQYTVKIDPNGGVLDHRDNPSVSTYFTADYGTTIGEYSSKREYIALSEKEKDPNSGATYDGTWYYYINTQRLGIPSEGDWGLPTELRNGVYVADADENGNGINDLTDYYNWYCGIVDNADPTYWTGIEKLSSEAEFIATYTSYPYRKLSGAEHYSFIGWFQVFDDGSVASMPYNFNDPVKGPITLRALWRLDGGYYLQYNPYYITEDGEGHVTVIVGEMDQWLDPKEPAHELYADQSLTHILRAPTNENTSANWIFRGWRVVKKTGQITYVDDKGQTHIFDKWDPIQFDDAGNAIYYQPGDEFIVDSELVTQVNDQGSVIHLQAYYELEENSSRRPKVTNLILDANDDYGGYVNTTNSSSLPALSGPGTQIINTTDELDGNGRPTQILLGDFQSNIALHLFRYATQKTFAGIQGNKLFSNTDNYLLLGFDEQSDPLHPSTGEAFIPSYSADSVVAVQREETGTALYAMWEPMVYVTFVNTTDEPIEVKLSGTGASTISIVNQVNGEFDRERITNKITIPAKSGNENGTVKIVLPGAVADVDTITANAVNDHLLKKMRVDGTNPKEGGTTHGQGTNAGEYIPYDGLVTYTGSLVSGADGIIVTYTEELDAQVRYDVNHGTWTDTQNDDPYSYLSDDVYKIEAQDIINNNYEPSDPTREGYIFIGWTLNQTVASHTDFSSIREVTWGNGDNEITITPDEGSIVLDKVKSDYLWDFTQEPPYGRTLYAVWSETVTVTFDVVYSQNENANPVDLHTWNGPATVNTNVPYEFYKPDNDDRYITYTVAKGEKIPKPSDPTVNSQNPTWYFIKWLIKNGTTDSYRYTKKDPTDGNLATHAFDFTQRVTSNTTLSTSWTANKPQTFTFTIENQVENGSDEEEFEYTIAVVDEKVWGKTGSSTSNGVGTTDRKWGSLTMKLKNNEQYTVKATVSFYNINWKAYGVTIEVMDSNGDVIKSGQAFYCNNNTIKNYVSDYKYTLVVTQEQKTGYVTTNEIKDNVGITHPQNFGADGEYVYKFYSCYNGTTGNSTAVNAFTPMVNGYVGGQNNSLTVVYHNRGAIVAPTGLRFNSTPFFITGVLGAGMFLASSFGKKKKKEDEADEGEA